MGESLFKNLKLGLSGPLAMLYLVWDVRVELSEVDEGGICAWGADIWNAGIRETRVVVRAVHGCSRGMEGKEASSSGRGGEGREAEAEDGDEIWGKANRI